MTVSEMIEWLKTQDQGATVEILAGYRGRNWNDDGYSLKDFDPLLHAEYTDMRGNPHAKGKAYENSRTLFLGYQE